MPSKPEQDCAENEYFVDLKCQDQSGVCADAAGPEKIVRKCVDNSKSCHNFDSGTKTCKECAKTHYLIYDNRRGNFCNLKGIFSVLGIGAILVLVCMFFGTVVLLVDWIQSKKSQEKNQKKVLVAAEVKTKIVSFQDNKLEPIKSPYDEIRVIFML